MNHNITTIHTEGGSVNSGPIDIQDGDFVVRDKVTYHNYTRLDPADHRNQRNHAVLRQTVRRFWVDGVLKSSLYNEMLIRLGLDARPEAVDNRPWDLILQQPGLPDEAIDDDKEIATIFDEMNQLLLILGEPGAGKTTTLLTLADALLHRADADPTLPTAVVFNLSSWAENEPPLTEWLVEELRTRYRMPKKAAHSWVENDELVLLLDGLDEVAADKRAACVKAINDFRQEHIVGIVVCSRTVEYSALSDQLKLEGAVAVRPLTTAQVDDYVAQSGPSLAGLHQALAQSEELRELAETPLMLSVMALAYHDQNAQGEPVHEERNERQHLFDRYIQRMFEHRELPDLYPADQTLPWLRWLAVQMIERSQALFLIERLQPDWLGTGKQINLYRLVLGLIVVLILVRISGLVVVLIFGPAIALSLALTWGQIAIDMRLANAKFNKQPNQEIWQSLKNGLIATSVGLVFGLILGQSAELYVLVLGYLFWLHSCIKHLILRCLLYHQDRIPWNYARFLDYAAARLFLRKVGGGYVFVHRMIMEHFASLTDEDIARIVQGASRPVDIAKS